MPHMVRHGDYGRGFSIAQFLFDDVLANVCKRMVGECSCLRSGNSKYFCVTHLVINLQCEICTNDYKPMVLIRGWMKKTFYQDKTGNERFLKLSALLKQLLSASLKRQLTKKVTCRKRLARRY